MDTPESSSTEAEIHRERCPGTPSLDGRLWHAVCRAAEELVQETDLIRALESIIGSIRLALDLDRVGIFWHDRTTAQLIRLVGIAPDGAREYAPRQAIRMEPGLGGPIRQVVRGEIPYFHSHDVRIDLPEIRFCDGVRAHAVVPLVAGGQIIGAMAVDNLFSGRDIDERLMQPLCLFGHFAAVALCTALKQRELHQAEDQKREFYREVVFAITNGKLVLCDRQEIDELWSGAEARVEIRGEADVRRVREQIKMVAETGGMDEQRLYDLGLCASEAATNALKHGEGGWAEVACQEGRVRVRIQDDGGGIEPLTLPRATLMKGFSTRQSMGLGFTIMHELADKIYLSTSADGTALILEMAMKPAAIPELPVALLKWED